MSTLLILLLGWALWTPDLDRAELDATYLAAPSDRVSVLDTTLHVRDTGPRDAPAVLMLHGVGASLHTWEPWALALSERLRVVRIDLPGSGLSPPDPQADYSDARSLALIRTLLDQLHLDRVALVGHSMGGRIAWRFAATYPQRVSKLVLVAPDGFASPGFDYGKAPDMPAVLGLMRYSLPRWLLRMNLEPAYARPEAMTDTLAQRYHDLLRAPGARQALLDRLQQVVLEPPEPYLQRITAPTLLVWGSADAMIPYANSDDYLRHIQGSRRVTLDGIGHVPQEEASDQALAPVRDFLLQK